MKIGMNLLLWTGHVTEEHYPHLEKIKAAGFDGVEIPLFQADEAHCAKLRRQLDELELDCTAVTISTAEANPISPDAKIRKAAANDLTQKIRCCAVLKAEVLLGPYHQPLGVFSGTGATEEEKKRAADVHYKAAEAGKEHGVHLAIEYLNRFECYFLNTAADAAAHVQRVNHPFFHTMYDTFHANIEEKDCNAAFSKHAKIIRHIHISENDRGTPGKGHVDWDGIFKAIRKAKYNHWLTIEAFGRALPDLAAATRVWRDFFPTPDEVYKQGIKFIRKKLAENA